MKFNQWSIALSALGLISAATVVRAEEAKLSQVETALSQTVLSGYISTSASIDFSRNGALPGRSFDGADKQDGFNLDVVKLALEKALTEDQWSAGYKAELLFGADSNFYHNSLNGGATAADSGYAVKNAYATLRAPVGNGLDFKMGVFDTVLGYEVFDAGSNPNFSRSYGFYLEPTHHTGLLASYKVSDMLSFSGGVANTYNSAINGRTQKQDFSRQAEGHLAYLGSATITLPESTGPLAGSALYAGFTIGKNGTGAAAIDAGKDTQSYYAGATINTGITGLTAGLAYDYRANGAATTTVIQTSSNYAWSAAGYLSYALTEKFKVNGRVDYTEGSDGTYYDGGVGGLKDQANKLYSVTGTADYSLWANVITRAEVRWDHASNSKPFGTGDGEKNAVTLAANVIYKF